MKTYNVKFDRLIRRKGSQSSVRVPLKKQVDALTFKGARKKIRDKYDDAISINIAEVPNSYRETEADIEFKRQQEEKKKRKQNQKDIAKNHNLAVVLSSIKSSPEIREAVEELLKVRPKGNNTVEDRIAHAVSDIVDYNADFIVRYHLGSVEVKEVKFKKKLNEETGRMVETQFIEDTFGDKVV
jgi:septum formation inhibitor MinC